MLIKREKNTTKTKRGDTLIEVALALAIFSVVTVIALATMNHALELMQGTLELTMTRNEIDAQAEALRYIQNSYLSERELVKENPGGASALWREYQRIWDRLTQVQNGLSNNPLKISSFHANTCTEYYNGSTNVNDPIHTIATDKAFILNTRHLDPTALNTSIISVTDSPDVFHETDLYPRVIYTTDTATDGTTDDNLNEVPAGFTVHDEKIFDKIGRAEGIWIIATRDVSGILDPAHATDITLNSYTPEFFDFFIRGCWIAPGSSFPSTISTIVRLYNPEYIEED